MTERKFQNVELRRIPFYSRTFSPAEFGIPLIPRLLFNARKGKSARIAYVVILMSGGLYRSSTAMRAGRTNSTESFSTIEEGICCV
jgi:hypothetical protein